MKVDEGVREELIKNLRDWLDDFNFTMKKIIDSMEKAKSVEEIMKLKKKLLLKAIDMLPIFAEECYFCILCSSECSICKYKDYHGVCHNSNSDYMKIIEKRRELMELIEKLYYKGEKYKED